jgi:hypothetical protein
LRDRDSGAAHLPIGGVAIASGVIAGVVVDW